MSVDPSVHSEIEIVDPQALSPEALALAIAKTSLSFKDGGPLGFSPRTLVEFSDDSFHETILHRAGVTDAIIYPDVDMENLEAAWISPVVWGSFRALASMSDLDAVLLARRLQEKHPSLAGDSFVDLEGEITKDLSGIIKPWAQAALDLLDQDGARMDEIGLLLDEVFAPDFLQGVSSIREIDERIQDATDQRGIHHPAALGMLFLRKTGLLDPETSKLGMIDGYEYVAGVPYALALAELAQRCQLPASPISLGDAYSTLFESTLRGKADAIASGASITGRPVDFNAPRFAIYHTDAILKAAAALQSVLNDRGPFAAVIAASDLLKDNDFDNDFDATQAIATAEMAFVETTSHSENVVREVLSMVLHDYLLIKKYLRETPGNPDEGRRVASRVSNALLSAFPDAEPITIQGRNDEMRRRLTAGRHDSGPL